MTDVVSVSRRSCAAPRAGQLAQRRMCPGDRVSPRSDVAQREWCRASPGHRPSPAWRRAWAAEEGGHPRRLDQVPAAQLVGRGRWPVLPNKLRMAAGCRAGGSGTWAASMCTSRGGKSAHQAVLDIDSRSHWASWRPGLPGVPRCRDYRQRVAARSRLETRRVGGGNSSKLRPSRPHGDQHARCGCSPSPAATPVTRHG